VSKKIALLLILFMVGSWCVFAEDEGLAPGFIILIAVGSVLLIGGTVAIILAASGDSDGAQRVMNSLSVDGEEVQRVKGNLSVDGDTAESMPMTKIMQNPLIRHTEISVNKDKVFVGAKFSW